MTTTTGPLAVAERLFAAIEAGDIDTVAATYASGAEIWHNTDGKVQTVDENLRVLRWLAANVRDLRYDEVRREATENGFVQQHVLRGTNSAGTAFAIPACIVCTVADGRVTRLDEYLDSAQVAALSG